MDWGGKLWDNVNDVNRYLNDQNELFITLTTYMKDIGKCSNVYHKSVQKLNKLATDTLNKRRKINTEDSSIAEFATKMIQRFDDIEKLQADLYVGIVDTLNDVTKKITELENDEKKKLNEIQKHKKNVQQLKTSTETARRTVLSKKLERETLNKQIDLVDKKDVQRYKKMQNELRDKSKSIDKATAVFEKYRQKLLNQSAEYYQNILYINLNSIQQTELSRSDTVANGIDRFLEIITKTHTDINATIAECTIDYSVVDVSKDILNFQDHYKSDLPIPKQEKINHPSLSDIGRIDHEVHNMMGEESCLDNSSLNNNHSTEPESKTEAYRNTVKQLEFNKNKLEASIKNKDALEKMVASCSKFGGFTESLQTQMMTSLADIERYEAQVMFYQEKLATFDDTAQSGEYSPAQYLQFSSDDEEDEFKQIEEETDEQQQQPHAQTKSPRGSKVEIVKSANEVISESVKSSSHSNCSEVAEPPTPTKPPPKHKPHKIDSRVNKTVSFDFIANQTGEISISVGDAIVAVGEDDGSGWTLISKVDNNGNELEGFVPTNYIE